jgi:hypothetical protein
MPGAYWRLDTDLNVLEIRLPETGVHAIKITGVAAAPVRLLSPLVSTLDFGFDTGAEGWRAVHDLAGLAVQNGVLSATATSWDPYLVRSSCDIDASGVRQVRVRLALDKGLSPGPQLFWATAAQPSLDEAKSAPAQTVADGEFHEVVFSVGENALWAGRITSVRLDPAGGGTGGIRVDYIRGE